MNVAEASSSGLCSARPTLVGNRDHSSPLLSSPLISSHLIKLRPCTTNQNLLVYMRLRSDEPNSKRGREVNGSMTNKGHHASRKNSACSFISIALRCKRSTSCSEFYTFVFKFIGKKNGVRCLIHLQSYEYPKRTIIT